MSYPEGWPSQEVRENMRADAAGEPLPHILRTSEHAVSYTLRCCCQSPTCDECHPTLSPSVGKGTSERGWHHMLKEEHLHFNSDSDCVRVAEFVISWLTADLSRADRDDAEHVAIEAKDVSVYSLLMDILVCVDGEHADAAKALRAKIGQ